MPSHTYAVSTVNMPVRDTITVYRIMLKHSVFNLSLCSSISINLDIGRISLVFAGASIVSGGNHQKTSCSL